MIVYKKFNERMIFSEDILWHTLLRQEDNDGNGYACWFLSDLEDTSENRTYLALKDGAIKVLSIQEYRTFNEEKCNTPDEVKRFSEYLQDAIIYLSQLTQ